MPFIDSKITVSLTPEKEEAIKTKLGEAIQILNKSETYLMVGFEDNYDLYMAVRNWTREHMFLSVCLVRHLRLPIQK